jgi:hypothetical protein
MSASGQLRGRLRAVSRGRRTYLLAEQLARTGSIEVALDRYERLWRPVVLEKQHIARGMVRWTYRARNPSFARGVSPWLSPVCPA